MPKEILQQKSWRMKAEKKVIGPSAEREQIQQKKFWWPSVPNHHWRSPSLLTTWGQCQLIERGPILKKFTWSKVLHWRILSNSSQKIQWGEFIGQQLTHHYVDKKRNVGFRKQTRRRRSKECPRARKREGKSFNFRPKLFILNDWKMLEQDSHVHIKVMTAHSFARWPLSMCEKGTFVSAIFIERRPWWLFMF